MFLNSSIGISEGVRATLFLRDCRKRNIIHRGGVDIKWNGPECGLALIGLLQMWVDLG